MLKLDRQLARELRSRRVRIDVPSRDTVLFRNVPVAEGSFSKPSTNLLIKRPRQGMPFLVCVDEDLDYVGAETALQRTFNGDLRRAGWKALRMPTAPEQPFDRIVGEALAALGFGRDEPEAPPAPPRGEPSARGPLTSHGVDLTEKARQGRCEPTVGREEETAETVSALLRLGQCRLAAIVGPSGVGKTNLLHACARKLLDRRPARRLVCVDLAPAFSGSLFESDREASLASLLTQAASQDGLVLALEHFELALGTPQGPLLIARALDDGLAIVGNLLPEYRSALKGGVLERRAHSIELREPTAAETVEIIAALRGPLATYHDVEIDEVCIKAVVRASAPLEGRLPAKAIALLDAAAARASLAGAKVVSADDVYHASARSEG